MGLNMKTGLIIIIVVLVLLVFWIISSYNTLIALKNKVKEAFATMDVYLKKRWDLIPNLVETVKGYAKHESEILEKVTKLRSSSYDSMSDEEKVDVNNQLTAGIHQLLAVAENYPDLKANQNFMKLSEELTNTENKISFSRQFYNDTVTMYNTKLQVFPSNIIAGMFNFTARDLFKAESDEARKNVKVDFGSNS